jgi:hypothetical protein
MEIVYYQLVKANKKDSTKGRPMRQVPVHLQAAVQAMLDADAAATATMTNPDKE